MKNLFQMYWTDQRLENYQYGEKNPSDGQEAKEWEKKSVYYPVSVLKFL